MLHDLTHFFDMQVPNWSRVGRLKRSKFPSLAGGGHVFGGGAGAGLLSATAGRLLCDTYLGARELLREVGHRIYFYNQVLLRHAFQLLLELRGSCVVISGGLHNAHAGSQAPGRFAV